MIEFKHLQFELELVGAKDELLRVLLWVKS